MVRFDRIPYLLPTMTVLLMGCLGIDDHDNLGGSDGVENPAFTIDAQSNGIATGGRVSLYSGNLNPALDSTPLLTKDLVGGKAEFRPTEIDSALKARLAADGRDTSATVDTVLRFNAVASSGDQEAFEGDFAYRRAGKKAGWTRIEKGVPGSFGKLTGKFRLLKAVPFTGRIGRPGILLGLDYVFIPGSPYHSSIAKDSTFSMARMAQGNYGIIGADKDSARYYASNDTLSTADTAYSAKDWGTITFIPDH